ncbi:MAG TPA: hypothetical protein VFP17_07610 [Solirubrobacterales bacterium]|nr:hypothetical protein [Solirubrobacterales bacterium]
MLGELKLSRSWFLWVAIAGCLAAGLVASPASAAPGWSRPTNVSGVINFGEEQPLLRVDSAGNATVFWRRYRNGKLVYESAVGGADGRWSTPSPLFGGLEDASGLQIAVDPPGNETAVWESHVGRSWVVQSATRSAGGGWSAPVTLSAAGARSALVAAGPEGNVTAVWLLEREEGWRSVVQTATRSADGSWSAPVTLSASKKAARSPQLALDPQGGATAVWEEEHSGAIESATRSADGSWSAPVTLSAAGVGAAWPQVAVDSQGNATAVWAGTVFRGRRLQSSRIQSASRPAGGSWSAPVYISQSGHRHVQLPQIAVSPQGEATAIWQRSNGSYLVVQGATQPFGGNWSKPSDITTGHGRGGQHLRLAVDPWGNATAIWEGYDTRPGPDFAIQAAKHPPGGAWSRPTDISRWTSSLGEPQIAVDPQGRSTAIWAIGAKGGAVIQSATSVVRAPK